MPTLEGIIFIPLALYFFFKRPHLLFPLLVASAAFQASSVSSSGSFGIQPYYCIAPLFILRFLVLPFQKSCDHPTGHSFTWFWITFALVSVVSACVLPFVFQGVPVFDPKLGIDLSFFQGPVPLRFQFGNIVQSVFLIVNVLVVVASTRSGKSMNNAHKMFLWVSYFVVLIVVLQDVCFWMNLPFPSRLFNNNPSYGLVPISSGNLRPPGTFSEPSMAGAVLVALLAALLWKYFAGEASIVKPGIAAVGCLLVASASSMLAGLIVFGLLILANPVVRFPWFIRIGRLKRFSAFFAGALVLSLLMIIPTFRTILLAQTLEKGVSDSALVRFGADAYAFSLTLRTHGMGVGLGSNRPSSFVAALLSQVGVLGFVLFICATWGTLRHLPKRHHWIRLATVGLLLAMSFGEPDLSFPFLWILLALAAQSKVDASRGANYPHAYTRSLTV